SRRAPRRLHTVSWFPSGLQSGLLQDTVQGAGRNFVTHLAGNGDAAFLRWVLELAVAAACRHLVPAIRLQPLQNLAHLHARQKTALPRRDEAEWPPQDSFSCQAITCLPLVETAQVPSGPATETAVQDEGSVEVATGRTA